MLRPLTAVKCFPLQVILSVQAVVLIVKQGADLMTEADDVDRRHAVKMARRKQVQDAEVASKTITSKGLLMVNTGPGKGKSTASFGLVLRALGHGWRVVTVNRPPR